MVQDSLLDYIGGQLKLGLTRDAVKAALVSAGWQAADVEDTLVKVQGVSGGGQSAAAASPAASSPAKPASSPVTLRMSDLVSAPAGSSSPASSSASSPKISPQGVGMKKDAPKEMPKEMAKTATEFPAAAAPRTGKGMLILDIVGGALIIGLGALAAYFYMQNNTLSGKVASLTTESAGVMSQLTGLQQAVDASTTDLTAQIQTLTAANQDLALNLSFFAPAADGSNAPQVANLTGTISGGGKVSYAITTSHGAKIIVQNSKDAKVIAALGPFVGSSTQVSGSYVPGSDALTVLSVNGVDLSAPPAAASSTPAGDATTTAATTTTTTLPPPPAPPAP